MSSIRAKVSRCLPQSFKSIVRRVLGSFETSRQERLAPPQLDSTWDQIMAEFELMPVIEQNRAINKAQMQWLCEVSEATPLKRALDLGFGCGFSSIAISQGGCQVTCVNHESRNEPRRVQAENRYRRICGQDAEIVEAGTDRGLPKLLEEGKQFGLIFVDAGHRFDDVFIDVHYSARLCVHGGILALDDTYCGAVRSVVDWVNSNLNHIWEPFQVLENTISWRRTAVDVDDWNVGIIHRSGPGPPKPFEISTENSDDFLFYCGRAESGESKFQTWIPKQS